MFIIRRFPLMVLGVVMMAGCSERDPGPPALDYDLADPNPVMPSAPPKYNPLLLADQATYKPLAPRDLTDKDREDLRKLMGIKAKPKAEEGEGAAEGEGAGGVKDIAKAGLKGLKSLLGGGKSEGKEEEGAGGEKAAGDAADMAKFLRSDARPKLEARPPNPAGRPEQGCAMAQRLAAEDATKNMLKTAVKVPVAPGQTIGDVLGTKQGVSETKLNELRPVAMKWADADTLEVEVEISIADLAASLKQQIPDANLDPVTQALDGKFLVATGRGVIPVNLRTQDRAVPGRRAAQATEGI